MIPPRHWQLPAVLGLACLAGTGCGLLLDSGFDDGAGPDGAGVDAGRGPDADPPSDARPVDGPAPDAAISPVDCAGRYGIVDRIATLAGGLSSNVDLATDATRIAVVGRNQLSPTSVASLWVDFHQLGTLEPIGGGGGAGDMTPNGPPLIRRAAERFHIASLEERGLVNWTKFPGGIGAPVTVSEVTAFGMTSETDPAREVLMLVARHGAVHSRNLPGGAFGPTPWASLTPASGHSTAALDLAWDEMNGAYAVVVGEEADGRAGHVWYALVDADGAAVATPVNLLVGASGSLPTFVADPSRWGVRLTLAGDKAVVVYRLAPDGMITGGGSVVDLALVDRLSRAVTQGHLATEPGEIVGASTAAGPAGTFGIVMSPESGAPLFQLRRLEDGAVVETVALEGSGAAVAIVSDPTDLGDFLVARKDFAPADGMLMRIGCRPP